MYWHQVAFISSIYNTVNSPINHLCILDTTLSNTGHTIELHGMHYYLVSDSIHRLLDSVYLNLTHAPTIQATTAGSLDLLT